MKFTSHNVDKTLALEPEGEFLDLCGVTIANYHALLNKFGQPLDDEATGVYWVVLFEDDELPPIKVSITNMYGRRARNKKEWKVYATHSDGIHLVNHVLNL